MELFSHKLKKLIFFLKKILIFQEGTCKDQKRISHISIKSYPYILGWLLIKSLVFSKNKFIHLTFFI